MNPRKVLSEILGVKYDHARQVIDSLDVGGSVFVGDYKVISLYRKAGIHHIRIERDGRFVGKLGV